MQRSGYLLDSNILIRWVQRGDPRYSIVDNTLDSLVTSQTALYYTSQNLGKFWNALTRPMERNGYGFRPWEVGELAKEVESQFNLLPDSELVHFGWRKMLVDCGISGVQVHDARLAAAMRVHGISRILTFNAKDFRRFPDVQAVLPQDLN